MKDGRVRYFKENTKYNDWSEESIFTLHKLVDIGIPGKSKRTVFTWHEIAGILNDKFKMSKSPDACRKKYGKYINGY